MSIRFEPTWDLHTLEKPNHFLDQPSDNDFVVGPETVILIATVLHFLLINKSTKFNYVNS